MRIIVLQGSPNREGSTRIMADAFADGASMAGHQVEVVDVARLDIRSCIGCVKCGYEGPCVQRDAMGELRDKILASDMIVFATPLYYFGMSSQLKTIIDRFCSFNRSLVDKRMKSALLSVAWDTDDWTFEALVAHYRTLVRYLDFSNQGMVLGYGCGTPSLTINSSYVERARAWSKPVAGIPHAGGHRVAPDEV